MMLLTIGLVSKRLVGIGALDMVDLLTCVTIDIRLVGIGQAGFRLFDIELVASLELYFILSGAGSIKLFTAVIYGFSK